MSRHLGALVVSVLVAACGSPSALPDAGGPLDAGSIDAGGRDAGGPVDAGGPDAGPPEPRLSSAILYRDDFDRYLSTAGLLAAYPDFREVRGAISLENGAVRIDYPADGGCADADVFIAKSFAGDVPALVVTSTVTVSSGFLFLQPAAHCGGAGSGSTEFVLSRLSDAPGRVSVEARLDTEGLGYVVRLGAASYTQQSWRGTLSPGALSAGARHRLTLFVAREGGAGASDGVVRLWVDGVAVLEATGAATGTAPFERVSVPGVLSAGASTAQTRWVDDVAVFTP